MKKVLITGTSQGLGKALAEEFVKRKYNVIASARNVSDIRVDGTYKRVQMDVTKPDMIDEVISEIGDIDMLINNAGITVSGPAENIPQEAIKKVFDTNFFGAVKLMQAVTPIMKRKGNGLIVNISSPASQFGFLYGSYYSGSKAALELVSEELWFELRHFGIEVMVMQCGAVDTKIAMNRKKFVSDEYADLEKQMAARFEKYERERTRPSATSIANQIIAAIEQKNRPFKTIIGNDAAYMLDMRKRLSDKEWEEQSPLTKNIEW